MTVQHDNVPPQFRRPIMVLMGNIGVGKTFQIVRALAKWGYLKSDPTALDAALDVIQNQPELAKEMGLTIAPSQTYNLINDSRTNWLSWLEDFVRWVDAVMARRYKAYAALSPEEKKKKRYLRMNLAGKSEKLGIKIPEPGLPGFVITDATTLWAMTMSAGKTANGSGWDTNDKVTDVLSHLIAVFYKWNLGLCFDGHVAEAVPDKQYPRGFAWPLGRMREGVAKEMAIVWELVYSATEDDGLDAERYVLTRPGFSPDNPLGTIRKTRRFGLDGKLDLGTKTIADYMEEVRFRLD